MNAFVLLVTWGLFIPILIGCSNDGDQLVVNDQSNVDNDGSQPLPTEELNHDHVLPSAGDLSTTNYQHRLKNAISVARSEQLASVLIGVQELGIEWESGNNGMTRDGETLPVIETLDCPLNGNVTRDYRFESIAALNYTSTLTFNNCVTADWEFNGSLTRNQRYQFAGHGSVNAEKYRFNNFEALDKVSPQGQTQHYVHGDVEITSQVTGFSDEFNVDISLEQYRSSTAGVVAVNAEGVTYQQSYFVATVASDDGGTGEHNYFREQMSVDSLSTDSTNNDKLSTHTVVDYLHEQISETFSGFSSTPRTANISLEDEAGNWVQVSTDEATTVYIVNIENTNQSITGDWLFPNRCHQLTQINHDTCRLNRP